MQDTLLVISTSSKVAQKAAEWCAEGLSPRRGKKQHHEDTSAVLSMINKRDRRPSTAAPPEELSPEVPSTCDGSYSVVTSGEPS